MSFFVTKKEFNEYKDSVSRALELSQRQALEYMKEAGIVTGGYHGYTSNYYVTNNIGEQIRQLQDYLGLEEVEINAVPQQIVLKKKVKAK